MLQLEQRQSQILFPKMVQNMEILQMGTQELVDYIQQVTQENPTLDVAEGTAREEAGWEARPWSTQFGRGHRSGAEDEEGVDPLEMYRGGEEGETLYEHLCTQLERLDGSLAQRMRVRFLMGCLDSNGWLDEPLEALAKEFGCEQQKMEEALVILQSMEPVGVGARGLKECLSLQLMHQPKPDSLALEIVENHLEAMSKHHYLAISKQTNATVKAVYCACERIRGLNPRPGGAFFCPETTEYVNPDVCVVPQGDGWEVVSMDQRVPTLQISREYLRMQQDCEEEQVREYLREKIKQAQWVIQAVEQRRNTLLSCVRYLAAAQAAFFHKGQGNLTALSLADAAGALGVHESTVSRTIRGKYLQCPWGVYPLSYFFSRRISGQGGTPQSLDSVDGAKALLRRLIEEENPQKPLSDQKLSQMMGERGCCLSRRTVAKYREELHIPSTTGRKRPR